MKISSVICEYNPFHNGHKLMLEYMRKNGATHIVACMSGNFTQRGDFAIFSKWQRTKTALLNGADLVVELPVSFSCANAERFALGGVYILNALGCVDEICFGSECGNTELLTKACNAITDSGISDSIKKYSSCGMTFAAAREKAVCDIYGSEISDILSQPNNILAVEYLKALKKIDSTITPSTISRVGAEHDSSETSDEIASASFVRQLIYEKNREFLTYIPENTFDTVNNSMTSLPDCQRIKKLENAVLYRLRTMNKNHFANLPDISEGLENRLMSAVRNSVSYDEIMQTTKCKRYTLARIRRCILHAFLGITKQNSPEFPPYIRVLGFNEKGREILRIMRKSASLPVIMRYADVGSLSDECQNTFAFESQCDDIYSLSEKNILKCGKNYTENIIRI
ncbi:MAG: nucleotidyltransferase [Clostridia bacterium]|nr:nucleotidyltransferase [Clostridia bacterium]